MKKNDVKLIAIGLFIFTGYGIEKKMSDWSVSLFEPQFENPILDDSKLEDDISVLDSYLNINLELLETRALSRTILDSLENSLSISKNDGIFNRESEYVNNDDYSGTLRLSKNNVFRYDEMDVSFSYNDPNQDFRIYHNSTFDSEGDSFYSTFMSGSWEYVYNMLFNLSFRDETTSKEDNFIAFAEDLSSGDFSGSRLNSLIDDYNLNDNTESDTSYVHVERNGNSVDTISFEDFEGEYFITIDFTEDVVKYELSILTYNYDKHLSVIDMSKLQI